MGDEDVKPIIARDLDKLPINSQTLKYDISENQLKEYFEYVNPSPEHSDIEISRFVKDQLKDTSVANWVYYPSRNTAIRMLCVEIYNKLATSRNRNIIETQEQEIIQKRTIAIAGLSVGGGIFQALVQSNIGICYNITDFDNLDTSNLNRLDASLIDVGRKKINIAAEKAYLLNPYISINSYELGIDSLNVDNFIENASIIFDAIDDFKMKVELRYKAKEKRIPLVMLTSLGDNVLIDIERYDLDHNQAIFHGILNDLPEEIIEMEIGEKEKVKLAIELVDEKYIPTDALSSLLEINKTINGRPQLGSTVRIDSGLACYITRGIFGPNSHDFSGRFYLDLNSIFGLPSDKTPTPKRKEILKTLGYV